MIYFSHSMNHADHVRLIRSGIKEKGRVWADLGSGTGAFTLALRDVIGPDGTIYSIDRDLASLARQKKSMDEQFPDTEITYIVADFTEPLELPPLDGILMANSLHFIEDTIPVLRSLKKMLKPKGRFLIVEYNADTGNQWVPYPFSFPTFEALAKDSGFYEINMLSTVPSDFLGEIYSAVAS